MIGGPLRYDCRVATGQNICLTPSALIMGKMIPNPPCKMGKTKRYKVVHLAINYEIDRLYM